MQEHRRLVSIRLVTILPRAELCGGRADEFGKSGVTDVADPEAQQEPVPERFKFIALRHLIARTGERNQRDVHFLIAIVKAPLVSYLQQGVKDCAVRLEDFIEENEFGLD